VALSFDGTVQTSFGTNGTAQIVTGITPSQVLGASADVKSGDGSVVLVGSVGQYFPPTVNTLEGVAARFTSQGQVDPGFGTQFVPGLRLNIGKQLLL